MPGGLLNSCFATKVFRAETSQVRTSLYQGETRLHAVPLKNWSQPEPFAGLADPLMCPWEEDTLPKRGRWSNTGVHDNEEDAFIIIWKKAIMIMAFSVRFMTKSKYTALVYHRSRGRCEVTGQQLSLLDLWEQQELSHTSWSWSHFIFQGLTACCV